MTRFQDKAQGMTKQFVGELIGDDKLVEDGKHQAHEPENETKPAPNAELGNADDDAPLVPSKPKP